MATDLALVKPADAAPDLTAIERVIVAGDLSKLTPDERWNYYRGVCQSVGLNPFTQPFLYITLSGKLVLYATKGAADQLRENHHISISQPKVDLSDGLCIVTVTATDRSGRTDSDLGIVPCENLRGDAKANAILKAVTKAKRRVTLSMCGLGMLDETEVETIPNARPVDFPVLPPSSGGPVEQAPENLAGLPIEPAGPSDRLRLVRRHVQLGRVAIEREHPKAEAINATDPGILSDVVLARSVKRLEELFPDVPPEDDLEDEAF